jgi:cell wall-associated NlpC family hydrolase
MTETPTPSTPRRLFRLCVALLVVLPSLVATLSVASAAPTEQEVADAKAEVDRLGHVLEQRIEAYNDARYQLSEAKQLLSDARARMETAQAEADAARAQLSDRAVEAYTGMGSQLDVLLEAQDFSTFSDRLTFMGAIAESDAAIAANADATGQKAEWAAQEYDDAVAKAQAHLDTMADERLQIQGMLDRQEELYATLYQERQDYEEYQAYLAAQEAALAAAQEEEQSALEDDGADTTPVPDPPPAPDPNATAAQTAIAAARSVLGASYVWGSAGPSTFDCSGLTSWAWAQAGVYLPHSAAAQYASLPRVALSAVQPGDIIYYGNFGPHVALYIGGGMIIHARHPGPGGQVQINSMYGYDTPYGAVRPG